ncbi:hypothetical protein ACM39_05635 [Chryseobacterium sp. FH2]|uniref:hypothetical protein n=1 Tax=Chryseobacterium sp. FH2 TaxID=1674291 RepID=UPI00065AB9E3|nr:hypothetical protein [Chryseobacterium sp. FH2]KMQ68770.1 hypothetical protein ACM39_05635 [Chryseobacterium sp. FH2]
MNKLKILKAVKIILLTIYIPVLLFYSGIVLPEYLACVNCNSEGAMGTDIWGDEVQCFGESKVFGEIIFQFLSMIVVGWSVVLIIVFFFIHHLKKTLK